MSDSLDKIFRDQQANVPPATPPPGQWERIQNGELTVEPGSKRALPYWWLALGLCLGLGVGVPAGAYFFGSECPTSPAAEVVVAGVETVDARQTKPSAQGPAPSTSFAPAAAPKKEAEKAVSVAEELPKPVAMLEVNQAPVPSETDVLDVPEQAPPVAKTQEGESSAGYLPVDIASVQAIKKVYVREEGTRAISRMPRFEPAYVGSVNVGALRQTLVRSATNSTVAPVKIGRRERDPLKRWEIGFGLMPMRTRPVLLAQYYTETDNGDIPRSFEFEGRDVALYRGEIPDFDALSRRLRFNTINMEGARQFNNGLRLGLGLTWNGGATGRFQEARDFFKQELAAGEWATFRDFTRREFNALAFVDYTFLRRRRFRPYLGFMFSTPVYSRTQFLHYLFEKNSGRVEVLNEVTSVSGFDLSSRFGQIRLGFQYDLSARLSIGLNFESAPHIGIGGRYKL
jgi:hypothetical protein